MLVLQSCAIITHRPPNIREKESVLTLSDSNLTDMQRAVRNSLKGYWRLFLFHGVILIILGVFALLAPVVATLAIDIFVGWLFLFSGVVGLVATFSSRDIPAFLWSLLTAALSLALGVLLIWKPVAGAASLTLVLTAFFLAEGLFQIVTSIAYREIVGPTWGWMLFSGVCDLALVAIIVSGWPAAAAWTLGVIVGVNLLTTGWAIVAVALKGREFAKSVLGR